jgi:hypothetical protein
MTGTLSGNLGRLSLRESWDFHDLHRPLAAYALALEHAGLLIEAIREPVPSDDYLDHHREVLRWRSEPCFLLLRARRP